MGGLTRTKIVKLTTIAIAIAIAIAIIVKVVVVTRKTVAKTTVAI